MSRILSPNRLFETMTPISLDTSNFIDLGKPHAPHWFESFKKMKASGRFTFCLADLCLGEKLKNVHHPKFNQHEFAMSIYRLQALLDDVLPILPGGVDMELLCGMNVPRETSTSSISEMQDISRKIWNRVSRVVPKGIINVKQAIDLSNDLEEIRSRYKTTFSSPDNTATELGLDVNTLPNDETAKRTLFDAFQQKFAVYRAGAFTCAQVLDLYIRLRMKFYVDHTRKNGYNPHKKYDNHPLDLLLFEALPLPALIVVDENMYNIVQEVDSYQRTWVFTAPTLAKAFDNGSLNSKKLEFQ